MEPIKPFHVNVSSGSTDASDGRSYEQWLDDFRRELRKAEDDAIAHYQQAKGAQPAQVPSLTLDGKLRIGDRLIVLTDPERAVIQALVELGAAKKGDLDRRSGVTNSPRILRLLISKYDLDDWISMPGGKGMGGYSTRIRLDK
jgi:hypothetical protein